MQFWTQLTAVLSALASSTEGAVMERFKKRGYTPNAQFPDRLTFRIEGVPVQDPNSERFGRLFASEWKGGQLGTGHIMGKPGVNMADMRWAMSKGHIIWDDMKSAEITLPAWNIIDRRAVLLNNGYKDVELLPGRGTPGFYVDVTGVLRINVPNTTFETFAWCEIPWSGGFRLYWKPRGVPDDRVQCASIELLLHAM